jgi:hypothetical protein
MQSQIRPAQHGEDTCAKCSNVASIYTPTGNYCLTHTSIDRDTFIAIKALTDRGLI